MFARLGENQLILEIFEKILKFTYKNLNGKLLFTHFSPLNFQFLSWFLAKLD